MCRKIQNKARFGEQINAKIDYDEEVERDNTSEIIAGVISEEANGLTTVKTILSYSD